jgi:hypothetical protein
VLLMPTTMMVRVHADHDLLDSAHWFIQRPAQLQRRLGLDFGLFTPSMNRADPHGRRERRHRDRS